ncbi:MAG TPA: peptidylprolyl isomerase [Gemmataceae bacterium]|nr:peptidylprolyl isomerase [Gemmataceae bacterium]
MRRFTRHLWNLLGRLADRPSRPANHKRRPVTRLELWQLEDRITPSPSTLGTVSGSVIASGNVLTPSSLQGIQVTLTGTSTQGTSEDLTATSDASGAFAFRSVPAGTYELTALPDASLIQGGSVGAVTVVPGQNTVDNITAGGLSPSLISLRDFLNTPPSNAFGLPTAGKTSNSPPVVNVPISNVAVASGGSTTIDLAANFLDPDMTNSQVVFNTSDGAMTVNLNDAAAPQTVANFLDYVENSRYDGTIFHRLDTAPAVLQGGGFGLQTNSSGDVTAFPAVANANDPQLANEFSPGFPDNAGTLAMAQPPNEPNGATSQFFFNLANNQNNLAGNFAVFGAVASDPTSQAVFEALQSTPVQNESDFNSAFNVLPISSSANLTSFPTNTTPSDYLTINNVQIVKQDESLTYSVVGNSNPSLVSTSFVAGHPEVLSINSLNPSATSGTATITVQATDQFGASVQASFQVTVEPLAITSVTNPINDGNLTTTTASGIGTAGETVSVTATDGTNTINPVTATVGANGTWTASNINVNTLADGTITYTATTTDADGRTLTATATASKNTAAPTVSITSSTNPVTIANQHNVTVSGTATAGVSISVTATDNTTTTPAVTTTASSTGAWSVNLDVSSLKDGTITYDVVATNSAGNTAANNASATKTTVAITSVTNPITSANETNTSASGTTEVGAAVTVTATDGTNTTAPFTATVDSSGNWTVSGIDVTSLQNGTITYKATATDASDNTATATETTTKGP